MLVDSLVIYLIFGKCYGNLEYYEPSKSNALQLFLKLRLVMNGREARALSMMSVLDLEM